MIVEAPKYGASRRAAAISAPSEAAPTTAATSWIRPRGALASASMDTRQLAAEDRRDEEVRVVERADRCTLNAGAGSAYLDGASGSVVHGHRHPELDGAIRRQLSAMASAPPA